MNLKKIEELVISHVVSLNIDEGLNATYDYEKVDCDVPYFEIKAVKKHDNGFDATFPIFIINIFDDYLVLKTYNSSFFYFEDRLKTKSLKKLNAKMLDLRKESIEFI